eukprot:Nk52_evm96s1444 gene=Nk52_evmTU96s1444
MNHQMALEDLQGAVCIVTGGSSGIGLETVKGLCKLGAEVIIATKNEKEAQESIHLIRQSCEEQEIKISYMHLNLLSFASVRKFVTEFCQKYSELNVLVNNAGIMMGTRDGWLTKDGLCSVMQVNYLSHFLLTKLLMPLLKAGGRHRFAKIINLSSFAHHFGSISVDGFKNPGITGMLCYSNSKLAMVMFTYELARVLDPEDNITVNCADPGPIYSGFYDNLAWPVWLAFCPFLWLMGPCEKGAETVIYLAAAKSVRRVTGKSFLNCKENSTSWSSHNEVTCRKLWLLSSELAGCLGDESEREE